jgi:hypothetical protein
MTEPPKPFDSQALTDRLREVGQAIRALSDAFRPLIVTTRGQCRALHTDYRRRQIARRKRRR